MSDIGGEIIVGFGASCLCMIEYCVCVEYSVISFISDWNRFISLRIVAAVAAP